MKPRILTRAYGVRIQAGDVLLSKVLRRPGPTHELLDVLAATATLAAGPRVAVLGFSGGGIVAPLRALGIQGPIEAVDVSQEGEPVFRRLCSRWCGEVVVAHDEASRWLARRRRHYDLIIEDLSAVHAAEVVKPPVSTQALPELIRRRLTANGLAVTNVLPCSRQSLGPLINRMRRPYVQAIAVSFTGYENRLLLGSASPLSARRVSRQLHAALRSIGSRQASRIRVTTLPQPDRG